MKQRDPISTGSATTPAARISFFAAQSILLLLFSLSCGATQEGGMVRLLPGITTISVPDTLAQPAKEAPAEKAGGGTEQSGTAAKEGSAATESTEKNSDAALEKTAPGKEEPAVKEAKKRDRSKQSTVKGIAVDIFVPVNPLNRGDMLVLPGWKFSRKRWQQETELLKLAEEQGLRLVFPEMSVSLYETEYFPETILRWAATPGGAWIGRVLIPMLQERYGLFRKGHKNFLLGLSTGGRGVVMTALNNPGVFTAGAALSGDFNQLAIPHDRLLTAVYGPCKHFMKRWYGVDNPEVKIITGPWEMPLYIGHGKKDRIVPFEQSKSLHEAIVKHHPKTPVRFSAPEKGEHDFNYWKSEVQPVIMFFLEQE
jgi:putative tributyrin esterase